MRSLAVVRLVAWREVWERGRSKGFLVSTLFSLGILAAVVVVASVAAGGDDRVTYEVGTLGDRPAEVVASAEHLAGDEAEFTVTEVADRDEAERLVEAGDLDAVVLADEVLVAEDLDEQLGALLGAGHREVALAAALADAGATPEQVAAASPRPLRVEALDADEAADEREGFALFGSMLLYGQLIGFGIWVASGIVEEKSSRVIELLLPKTRAAPLLAGKVLGVGAMGLAQLVLFVATGLGLTAALGAVDLPPGITGAALALVGWFLVGYALYACLFAVGGALASRSEELQSTTSPITLVIVAAFFASVFAAEDPAGTTAQVAGLVPFTAPLVMPVRMAAGAAAAWEVAAALALVAVAITVTIRLAARAYAGGVLHTRGRLGLRDALARARG